MSFPKNQILSRASGRREDGAPPMPLRGLKRLYAATPRKKRHGLLARLAAQQPNVLEEIFALEAVQWGEPPTWGGLSGLVADMSFGMRLQYAPNMRARTGYDGRQLALRAALLSSCGVPGCVPRQGEEERTFERRLRVLWISHFGRMTLRSLMGFA